MIGNILAGALGTFFVFGVVPTILIFAARLAGKNVAAYVIAAILGFLLLGTITAPQTLSSIIGLVLSVAACCGAWVYGDVRRRRAAKVMSEQTSELGD